VTPAVLTSTTSHKKEPLLPALEIFAKLGLVDVDINLHHILEAGAAVDDVAAALDANGQRAWVVSGGWCDFFEQAPGIDRTFASVARQVAIARRLGVGMLRLFFGRLPRDAYNAAMRAVIVANLQTLSARHDDVTFVFENHDGASLVPSICREVLAGVDRPNIRMNFDPINFEKVGVRAADALDAVAPFVAHMHLKGLENGEYCEFGTGDIDLMPVLEAAVRGGYRGRFSVEYEGTFDGTLRLYQSVQRARRAVESLIRT
jgi:sugar phosphate isomerase/epimerase